MVAGVFDSDVSNPAAWSVEELSVCSESLIFEDK